MKNWSVIWAERTVYEEEKAIKILSLWTHYER